MIINDYMSVEKIKELCGDKFHINEINVIGQSDTIGVKDLTSYYAVYAYDVDHKTNNVSIHVGMSKEIIQNVISDLSKNMVLGFNAVSIEEMAKHFNSINKAIQFIECGKRVGLLESCGEGFYAYSPTK